MEWTDLRQEGTTHGRLRGQRPTNVKEGEPDHIPFVTDHSTVMQAYDMCDQGWNADEQRVRTQPQPIGWQLKEEHVSESRS